MSTLTWLFEFKYYFRDGYTVLPVIKIIVKGNETKTNNYLLQRSTLQSWLGNALTKRIGNSSSENFGYIFHAILPMSYWYSVIDKVIHLNKKTCYCWSHSWITSFFFFIGINNWRVWYAYLQSNKKHIMTFLTSWQSHRWNTDISVYHNFVSSNLSNYQLSQTAIAQNCDLL